MPSYLLLPLRPLHHVNPQAGQFPSEDNREKGVFTSSSGFTIIDDCADEQQAVNRAHKLYRNESSEWAVVEVKRFVSRLLAR